MVRINLGLQGGGAHGAFTWGVLDRILQDDGIEIAAISATSAGALNAAALKAGFKAGGREGARAALDDVWRQVGAITEPMFQDWLTAAGTHAGLVAKALEYSPAFTMFDLTSRMLSPYALGPFLRNPLEKIVRSLDFGDVCSTAGPELYICATNVRSGKLRVFSGTEIGPEAIMASACLPTLFQAVEMEDPATGKVEAYWDGGFAGNPALGPLLAGHLPDDIVIVKINPMYREDLPYDTQSIHNRINEISFNSSLLRELRAFGFVHDLIESGALQRGTMRDPLIHFIADDALMNMLNVATKTIATPIILARLKAAGAAAADQFLERHRDDLGKRGSVNLSELFS
jgi:NTE family protein